MFEKRKVQAVPGHAGTSGAGRATGQPAGWDSSRNSECPSLLSPSLNQGTLSGGSASPPQHPGPLPSWPPHIQVWPCGWLWQATWGGGGGGQAAARTVRSSSANLQTPSPSEGGRKRSRCRKRPGWLREPGSQSGHVEQSPCQPTVCWDFRVKRGPSTVRWPLHSKVRTG